MRVRTTIALLSVIAMVGTACGDGDSSDDAGARGVTDDTVRFGMTCGFSSSAVATLCEDARNGLSAAIEVINAAGGVHGRNIELVTADEQYDAALALGAAKRLVEEEEVLAFLVPAGTTPILAYLDYAREQNVPIIAPIGGLPSDDPIIYAGQPSYDDQMMVVSRYQQETFGAQRIGFIHVANDAGQAGLSGMEKAAEALGLELVSIAVPADQTNFSTEVSRFAGDEVDAILSVFTPTGLAAFVQELDRQGVTVPFGGYVGTTDLGAIDVAGDSAKLINSAFSAVAQPTAGTPEVESFLQALGEHAPDQEPRTWTTYAYGYALVIADVLERAGADLTLDGFISALNQTASFETGLFGAVTWSMSGDSVDHGGTSCGQVVAWDGQVFVPQTDFICG